MHPLHHLRSISALIGAGIIGVISAQNLLGQSLIQGDLLVTRSTYEGNASTVTLGQALPGGGNAIADGSYPNVFNNETPDPSFGVTSPIFIDQFNLNSKNVDNTINITQLAAQQNINLSTSFPSKSELALNVSANGAVTFMGYVAPVNALDVSNSNTPGHVDPTNPVTSTYQRAVAQLNSNGTLAVTPVNAYSGNNGRAAVLADGNYYTVGNAGNGSGKEPVNIVSNTGVQSTTPGGSAETTVVGQQLGTPGNANGFEYGYAAVPADKSGKDDNFRGLTVFNNTLYVSKGSGSNGVDTVYQVGAVGSLGNLAANASTAAITILPGFNTVPAKTATAGPNPFGLFFANASTLYVADEGNGLAGNNDPFAGLEKWVNTKQDGTGVWNLAYTLSAGLDIGSAYAVNGPNSETVTTETSGLRNITGIVNGNSITFFGITSTAGSSLTDAGGDPNKLVEITDGLDNTTGTGEQFSTLETAAFGDVLRGVAFTAVPEPSTYGLFGAAGLLGLAFLKKRKSR